MPFDQDTRNRLNRFVSDARTLLTKEFTNQLQHRFGMDPTTGTISPIDALQSLNDRQRETARILRETLDYYQSESPDKKQTKKQVIDRILREQAFTVLNRLCALRLAEARGLILETIAKGYQSEGFQLYKTLAGPALGEMMDAYQTYLFSVFDELAVELLPLFYRFSPEGRLFPSQTTLQDLLEMMNDPELAEIWSEDETIGWIYQYFNSQEERRAMRAASSAPRNSRELAVRNQFFTPRYVVEFLTDNTLGRLWYEMTQGNTGLVDQCDYLVHRKHTFFLKEGQEAPEIFDPKRTPWGHPDFPKDMWVPPNPDLDDIDGIFHYALTIDGYQYAQENLGTECGILANAKLQQFRETANWEGSFEELRCCLFFEQRRYHHFGEYPKGEDAKAIQDLYQSICERWDYEVEFVPYRPLKDPREIKMLDPACGSMHFGLYAFDLFEQIYTEAWNLEEEKNTDGFLRLGNLDSLHEAYPDKETFLIDIPRLIIERNIHGIDIDPRAVQIAGLSLWLRAQKSWAALEIKPETRPQIRKSNVVCAEPMPGDREMLEDFLSTLDEEHLKTMVKEILPNTTRQYIRITTKMVQALNELVRTIWKAMELAGEAGSLLKIEDILKQAIMDARRQSGENLPLLQALDFGMGDLTSSINLDFWTHSAKLVLKALKRYAEQLTIGNNYQRRLFTYDALQGFSFIQITENKYDVALMNPPFGEASTKLKPFLKTKFPTSWYDLGATFIDLMNLYVENYGFIGCITNRTIYFSKRLRDFRSKIFDSNRFNTFSDLGSGVLDGGVETAATSIQKTIKSNSTYFFRATDKPDKEAFIHSQINNENFNDVFVIPNSIISSTKDVEFCYWLPIQIQKLRASLETLSYFGVEVKQGIATGNNFRFLRLIWEIPIDRLYELWHPYSKGGDYSPFYYNIHLCVMWSNKWREFYYGNTTVFSCLITKNQDKYLDRPGLTYPTRTSSRFGPRLMPSGTIFDTKGSAIFSPYVLDFPDDKNSLYYLLGILNSNVTQILIDSYVGAAENAPRSYSEGIISDLPLSIKFNNNMAEIENIKKLISQLVYLSQFDELSPYFFSSITLPHNSIKENYEKYSRLIERTEKILIDVRFQFDNHLINKYGLDKTSIKFIDHEIEKYTAITPSCVEIKSLSEYSHQIISQLFGCLFGRYDINICNNSMDQSSKYQPFNQFPKLQPGMLKNTRELPAKSMDIASDYPILISWKGIIVEDEGHTLDLKLRLRDALHFVWGEQSSAIETELCQILDISALIEYFNSNLRFFEEHLKQYSKSRRYAPIYWPLSTPSGSYTLWLYYHRIDDQILFTCVNDFVDPKLKQISADIAHLRSKQSRTRSDEDNLEKLSDLEIELKEFREELLRVAAFWKPNLNDGVEITASPLWRLFQHRSWQNRLKETWNKLEDGEYDWAHLAYSIWPERVREKCKTDKSIAIAHDLEHLFQEEG